MPELPPPEPAIDDDPYRWLEDVLGDEALAWVRRCNEAATSALAGTEQFDELRRRILSILDSDERIRYVAKRGDHYYNLWQDATNRRGLWRRTTWDSYRSAEPVWETVLDLDALARDEGENWVWHGSTWFTPTFDRCLVSLSRGGADASVVREFDPVAKRFVPPDEGGFVLPEAKSQVAWADRDTLWVATDTGPGSMTDAGYPRLVKLWRRATPLDQAELMAEGRPEDVSVGAFRDLTEGFERDVLIEALTFFTNRLSLWSDGRWVPVDKPDSAEASFHRQWLVIELRDDWEVGDQRHRAGSLLVTDLDDHLAGRGDLQVLFSPTERSSLAGWSGTRHHLIVNVLDNVHNVIHVATPDHDGGWRIEPLPGLPELGTVSVGPVDDETDDYWLTVTDYLTPTSLWRGTIGGGAPTPLERLPEFFDTEGLVVDQREAVSADGTRVPYFLVKGRSATLDGTNPTVLYGYGGFEIALTPGYDAVTGACWLAQGGAYAVANIRGGGEFGPRWHQAALKADRHKAYEDFAAVARHLIDTGVTSPRHLGIRGGSNGGLLVGNLLVRHPELFGAVVCQVPLLDMLTYHRLLAGASWIGEYGDPEVPEEAAWLRAYSPYHNVSAGVRYPEVLFTTSTRDDRVHPGHARKMTARMLDQGHTVLYYENIEGGHGGAADNEQAAFMSALAWTFLRRTLH